MSRYDQVLPEHSLSAHYGWDRPLKYYFLTVTQQGKVLYSSLDDPAAHHGTYGGGLDLSQLDAQLGIRGFSLNTEQRLALLKDAQAPAKMDADLRLLLNGINSSHTTHVNAADDD